MDTWTASGPAFALGKLAAMRGHARPFPTESTGFVAAMYGAE